MSGFRFLVRRLLLPTIVVVILIALVFCLFDFNVLCDTCVLLVVYCLFARAVDIAVSVCWLFVCLLGLFCSRFCLGSLAWSTGLICFGLVIATTELYVVLLWFLMPFDLCVLLFCFGGCLFDFVQFWYTLVLVGCLWLVITV